MSHPASTTAHTGVLPTARAVPVPPGTAIHATLHGSHFHDAYAVPDHHPDRPALQAWLDVATQTPSWIRALMLVRNKAVRLVGLKDVGQLQDGYPPASGKPPNDAASYAVGDRVGIFRIRFLSDREVILGQDDRHLDVQVSILRRDEGTDGPTLVLSTVVHIHNTLGHAYMAVITPFHRVIARSLTQRMSGHGQR